MPALAEAFQHFRSGCELPPEYTPQGFCGVTNSHDPDNLWPMAREISAGGVVVRHTAGGWDMAAIEPQRDLTASTGAKKRSQKVLLALPKGLVDPGETPEQTAIREVWEETGITATPVLKLGDIKYVYVRSWGDRQRVFKIVSFYLLRYQRGRIDEISLEMRVEVKRATWIALEDATRTLAYRGERDMVRRAQQYLKSHPEA
jgi:8-oxo-dGTP pyrophosphatase MutT (NUDIX family)